jgi:hypothetical protein
VFRLFKPAFAVVAIVGLVAAGCGGSSGTPGPTAPPPISDPNEIITRSVTDVADATSLHFRADVSGKVNMSSLGSDSGLSGSIDLAGTYAEGDVDIQNQAADLKFGLPGLLGLSGRVIIVDGYMYMQMSLQGDKYTKSKLDESLPVDLPSPDASASGAIASQVEELRKSLQDAGMTATLKGDEKVEGKDCYHVQITIPADELNNLLSEGGDTTAGLAIDSLSLDYWVYKDSLRPAKISISGAAADAGNLTVDLVISDYDKSVDIQAPDPSQIQEAPAS